MDDPLARIALNAVEVARGRRGSGDVDLLVAIMGEPANVASLDGFIESIGPDLGAVTLVRPATGGGGGRARAETDLATAALFVSTVGPRLLVLTEPSTRALHDLVMAERADVAVVMDDPACAATLRRLTASLRVRVMGVSMLTPRRPSDR